MTRRLLFVFVVLSFALVPITLGTTSPANAAIEPPLPPNPMYSYEGDLGCTVIGNMTFNPPLSSKQLALGPSVMSFRGKVKGCVGLNPDLASFEQGAVSGVWSDSKFRGSGNMSFDANTEGLLGVSLHYGSLPVLGTCGALVLGILPQMIGTITWNGKPKTAVWTTAFDALGGPVPVDTGNPASGFFSAQTGVFYYEGELGRSGSFLKNSATSYFNGNVDLALGIKNYSESALLTKCGSNGGIKKLSLGPSGSASYGLTLPFDNDQCGGGCFPTPSSLEPPPPGITGPMAYLPSPPYTDIQNLLMGPDSPP